MKEPTPTRDLPSWFDEVSSSLAYSDHLVFSGNVGDLYPSPNWPDGGFQPFEDTLWALMRDAGIRGLLRYNPVQGLYISNACGEAERESLATHFELNTRPFTLSELAATHALVAVFSEFRVGFVIDYASHLGGHTGESIEEFFVRIDLNSLAQRRTDPAKGVNPTIWMVDHPADLPDWFVLNNASLREIQIERPNLEDRFAFAQHLAGVQGWLGSMPEDEQERQLQQFALECDGKPLLAMDAIAKVAQAENLRLAHISDAIRVFRTGSRRNPWTSPVLRKRMQQAADILQARIKGQPFAIEKSLDILARSILGLSGAQSGAMHTRPRGGLFFVGPTGVGKTELAKSITELLFGDETLCHRFDMSEFMEESSVSRLIGSPPGHADHEKGGELVNAALRRPFSVFLFDEVEKAHPRVLDLFLQILDEGRLTDARGATAYFSEALIIFTSNIGIAQGARETNMGMSVLPSDTHFELSHKIRRAVEEHFRMELKRPELLNRIGQNIVVFDFLSPAGMCAIFDSILDRVVRTVENEQHVSISLRPEALNSLRQLCTQDFFDGGRGIANRIETHFINPLARHLFPAGASADICIAVIEETKGRTVLQLDTAKEDTARGELVHPIHPEVRDKNKVRRVYPSQEKWRSRFESP